VTMRRVRFRTLRIRVWRVPFVPRRRQPNVRFAPLEPSADAEREPLRAIVASCTES